MSTGKVDFHVGNASPYNAASPNIRVDPWPLGHLHVNIANYIKRGGIKNKQVPVFMDNQFRPVVRVTEKLGHDPHHLRRLPIKEFSGNEFSRTPLPDLQLVDVLGLVVFL